MRKLSNLTPELLLTSFVAFVFIISIKNNIITNSIYGPPFETSIDLLLIYLFGFCFFGLSFNYFFSKLKLNKLHLRYYGILFFILLATVFFIKPLFSQDIYWNLLLSKGYIVKGLNPYITTPNDLSNFELFNYIHMWKEFPLTHGPISLFLHALPYLFTESDIIAIFIVRTISIFAIVASFYIPIFCIKENTFYKKINSLIIVVPFLLVNLLIDLHNDVFAMLSVILSYYYLQKNNYFLSFAVLIVGFLVKFIPIILILIPFIKLFRSNLDVYSKIKVLLSVFLFSIVLTSALYLPFIHEKDLLVGLNYQNNILSNAFISPISYYLLFKLNLNTLLVKVLGIISSVLIMAYFCINQKYKEAYIFGLLVFFIIGMNWLTSWYFVWILPLLILIDSNKEWFYFIYFIILGTFGVSILHSIYFYTLFYVFRFILSRLNERV